MKFDRRDIPRVFNVGQHGEIAISDCGRIQLLPDEQVTFVTEAGGEYDIVRKDWGFYATPSTNDRLVKHGFSTVLVRSPENKIYVFLVEPTREQEFQSYVTHEGHTLILWLDGKKDDLAQLDAILTNRTVERCLCGSSALKLLHVFDAPSKTEVRFSFAQGTVYERRLYQCANCKHIRSIHGLDDEALYLGEYVNSNYGTGLRATFDRINALPAEKSDNVGRVAAVGAFARQWFGSHSHPGPPAILDVGSGLCVFLHRVKAELGWACTALDPDPRAAEHARTVVGVEVIQGDFRQAHILRQFDVVTLNKVIEHVQDPIEMLKIARATVTPTGFIYLEVPDGEHAILDSDGPDREEFTIDHPHAFSMQSMSTAVTKAGLSIARIERLREPSGKYTIRAFAAA